MSTYLYDEDSGERREFEAASATAAHDSAEALLRHSIMYQIAAISLKSAEAHRGVEFPVTVSANVTPVDGYDVAINQEDRVQVTLTAWPTAQERADARVAWAAVGSHLALI
jgi:hypothetical protein